MTIKEQGRSKRISDGASNQPNQTHLLAQIFYQNKVSLLRSTSSAHIKVELKIITRYIEIANA